MERHRGENDRRDDAETFHEVLLTPLQGSRKLLIEVQKFRTNAHFFNACRRAAELKAAFDAVFQQRQL
jgi:hypothetical protein